MIRTRATAVAVAAVVLATTRPVSAVESGLELGYDHLFMPGDSDRPDSLQPCYWQVLRLHPRLTPFAGLTVGMRFEALFRLHPQNDQAPVKPLAGFASSHGPGAVLQRFPVDGAATAVLGKTTLNDLELYADYGPAFARLLGVQPVLGFHLLIPTNEWSRDESLVVGLGPALDLHRRFEFTGRSWLPRLDVSYGFRAFALLHDHVATACCLGRDVRINDAWRLSQTLSADLTVAYGLYLGADLQLFHHFTHELSSASWSHWPDSGISVPLSPTPQQRRDYLRVVAEVGYRFTLWAAAAFSVDHMTRLANTSSETRRTLLVLSLRLHTVALVRGLFQ